MTFDAPVTVTGDPTFAFDLGGATTATYYAGSGTTTLRFSHAVSGGTSGDRDTNGISWAENAIALNGGTIAGTDNGVYPGFPMPFWGLSGFFVGELTGKALWKLVENAQRFPRRGGRVLRPRRRVCRACLTARRCKSSAQVWWRQRASEAQGR